MFDKILGLLAPHDCLNCGAEGSLLCEWCAPEAMVPLPERCYRCHAVSRDSAVCDKCRQHSPLRYVWVTAQYEGLARVIVYQLKFARTRAAAKLIARFLDESLPFLSENTVVTYVPTATGRVRQRGYDQAQLIARSFAKRRGLTVVTLLARHGQARQVGADRSHRIKQAANNYSPVNVQRIQNAEILLIDDITTTGASLESAAKVLKKAGAKKVNAAVFAQK